MSNNRYYDTRANHGDIEPGKVSDELRGALGLAKNELPIWIYRMRALGYPPGWLNKAIVDTSDIFDTDKSLENKDSGNGDKRKSSSNDEIQYDHSKLIEYPGFNVPIPPGINDYCYYHNMPPVLPHQQLDYAKKQMTSFKSTPVANKRARLAPSSSKNGDDQTNETNEESSDEEEEEDGGEEENGADKHEDPASPDAKEDEQKGDVEPPKAEGEKEVLTKANTSVTSLSEEIKLVSKGSPMPKPVKRLPLERFSEGVVGDVLYFENLPQSCGKFDSIRSLLRQMK